MASPYQVRKAACFTMKVADRPGQGARILSALAAHGVNLIAFTGVPAGGQARLEFVPHNPKKLLEAAGKLGYKVSGPKVVFVATGKDRAGIVATICGKLAAAGIGMVAMDAVSSGAGRFGAVFSVKPQDVARAARALNAR